MTTDPYVVLGVGPDADEQQLAAARRRLARSAHPDLGGSNEAMKAVNEAYTEALARLHAPVDPVPSAPPPATPPPAATRARRRPSSQGPVRDDASFTIDVLPVEAFDALLVVASWIGEVLVDEPPYVLEVFLDEPEPCWCRLELVPHAGASTVSLTVAGVEGPAPDVDDVRDVWVRNLNRLGPTT